MNTQSEMKLFSDIFNLIVTTTTKSLMAYRGFLCLYGKTNFDIKKP